MPDEKTYTERQQEQAWMRFGVLGLAAVVGVGFAADHWAAAVVPALAMEGVWFHAVVMRKGAGTMPLQYWKRVGRWWLGVVFVGVTLDPDSELGEAVEELIDDE